MTIPRRVLATLAGLTALVLLGADPATAAAIPPPASMASIGDSITRGFNACVGTSTAPRGPSAPATTPP
ncbi:hypothetical protein [Micromonospora sp. ATA51]|uniref:hypothetical protein n=1 Tax=Micromonospora sp. ATA51 TaxID=2806098 RepID=UPI001EE49324|nr:hypothetical protein [Micromonospora sp. ATA51]